jgi:methionyl aminopeptidase
MARHGFELKTNEQIILMREAGLATAAALKAVREAIKPGVSTLELDKIADDTINSLGGHSNFQLVPGYSHTICASINEEVVHGIPAASRTLQAGDIVSIDCGAEIGEWNGDSAISAVHVGQTTDAAQADPVELAGVLQAGREVRDVGDGVDTDQVATLGCEGCDGHGHVLEALFPLLGGDHQFLNRVRRLGRCRVRQARKGGHRNG